MGSNKKQNIRMRAEGDEKSKGGNGEDPEVSRDGKERPRSERYLNGGRKE